LILREYCRAILFRVKAVGFVFIFYDSHQTEQFGVVVLSDVPFEAAAKVFAFGKFAFHFVAWGRSNPEKQGFQFFQVLIADREINAEAIPKLAVSVAKMALESASQVRGQANVIQLLLSIERVDAVAFSNVIFDDFLVAFQGFTRNIFELLTNEGGTFGHDSN
jgi:hypothetical protein